MGSLLIRVSLVGLDPLSGLLVYWCVLIVYLGIFRPMGMGSCPCVPRLVSLQSLGLVSD